MKCPYMKDATDIETALYFSKEESDDIQSSVIVTSHRERFGDCLEEECACFEDGKCKRKGA